MNIKSFNSFQTSWQGRVSVAHKEVKKKFKILSYDAYDPLPENYSDTCGSHVSVEKVVEMRKKYWFLKETGQENVCGSNNVA